jgi:hypothetical protein
MTGISLFLVLQLHHMDRSPYAAVAPVTLLWRPVPKELQSKQSVGLIPAEKRQVWVWVHAAAFDEALMCLQTACQRQVRHVLDLLYAVWWFSPALCSCYAWIPHMCSMYLRACCGCRPALRA